MNTPTTCQKSHDYQFCPLFHEADKQKLLEEYDTLLRKYFHYTSLKDEKVQALVIKKHKESVKLKQQQFEKLKDEAERIQFLTKDYKGL